MAMLLPLAFAGAGYLGFGQIGAAVGWLVGAWLFGPKAETENQIFDPGAQEMPRFNQSLRGVTIPVLFGTNRVASNVVWVNNFQTIRKESEGQGQGGGKGGGSGGGGKGGQASQTEVTYEYKWDMIFSIGMGPEPYGIFGGWVNTQRMSGETVLAIMNDAAGMPPISSSDTKSVSYSVTGGTSQTQQEKNTATLTFEDSYFGVGGPTGDTGFAAWDYFESITGSACRWPYTYYIGFKALSLGSNPSVPQLSWEIGPGDVSFTRNPTFLNNNVHPHFENPTNCVMVGEDGNHWVALTYGNGTSGNTQDMNLWCFETGAVLNNDYTTLPTAFTDLGAPVTPAGAQVLSAGGSPYVVHLGYGFAGGSDVSVNAKLFKINTGGTLTELETYAFVQPDGQQYALDLANPVGFGFMSFDGIMSQSSGYPTWIMTQNGSPGGKKILLLTVKYQGTIAQGAVQYPIPDSQNMTNVTDLLIQEVATAEGIGYIPNGMRYDNSYGRAFMLPEYHSENHVGSGNGKWPIESWVCFYVNKAMIAADDGSSPAITANKAAYPNGFVVGWKITGKQHPGFPDIEIDGPTVLNDRFLDETGAPLAAMFDDSGLDKSGVADQNSDYLCPNITVTPQGGVVLTFPKVFDKAADVDPTGSYTKLKVFVWNPSDKTAKFYTESEGSWFDQSDVSGPGTGFRETPEHIIPFFDYSQSQMYVFGNFLSGEGIGNNAVASIWGPMSVGGGKDVLCPYIVYQVLTNPVFGMGIPEADIDQTSYQLALQFCDANNYRVSVQYVREESLLGVIEEVLALYGGYLIDSGGKVRFGIQQFTSSPVRTIDNHHLVVTKAGDPPVQVTKAALVDGYNKIRMNYFDRTLDYRQNQLEIGDEVDQDFNGVRFKEFPAKFVMKVDMAQSVIERALWTNLYARDTFAFKLGWKDADLEPGDVITLVDSFHPELAGGKNVRIVRWQEKERGKFNVTGVQEVPYYTTASHAVDATNSAGITKGLFDEVLPCSDFRMYELPREFQTSAANLFVGYNQLSNIRGATLWLSNDDITYTPASNSEPYIISGQFARSLPASSPGNVERDVEMYIMPASGFSVATPTYCQTLALDDVNASGRSAGAGVLICGSEALAMENLTLLAQNRYRIGKLYRGWGGTAAQAHSSGALWHKHGGGIFITEINPDKIGTNIWYKVSPYNFAGQAYDISSVTGKQYTIRGAYWLPQEMPGLATFVDSPLSGTNSQDLGGNVYKAVVSGGCNVTFDWPDCARLDGYGTGGFGKSTFGHFLADLDSHRWRVEVMSGGTVVRSTAVDSGPFTYTRVANSADFAGFGGVFQVRVTPFNNYGDAPISTVKSLNLFG